MKRLLMILLLIPLLAMPVSAASTGEILSEQAQKSGAADLSGQVPSSARGSLSKLGVNGASPQGVSGFSLGSVFSFLWQRLREAATAPFKAIAAVLGILLLCALVEAMKNAFAEKSMKTVFEVVCTLAIAGVLAVPITKCIAAAAATVRESSTFMTMFLPVYGGLAVASGHPTSGVVSQGIVLVMAQVISQIASTTFVPMVSMFLAFCIIGSIAPGVNIGGLAAFARKIVNVGLVLVLTIFTAVLTIQGFITQAADTVTMKTAKFVVSSAVPVVGGAVSDALNTVASCAGLLKNATGAYAIIVFLAAYLPVLLECLLWLLAVELSLALAEVVGVGNVSDLLKGVRDALQMLVALVVACALAMIVSVCIMLLVSGQVT
ncbi:stage III sporulation protein AE [Ethanoligenens sp.]|uniref:stage III sporulation protein AE n=1 Tax=Ethanoligenens sp. TaxID=2099655 RepID=UPI0039EA271F